MSLECCCPSDVPQRLGKLFHVLRPATEKAFKTMSVLVLGIRRKDPLQPIVDGLVVQGEIMA